MVRRLRNEMYGTGIIHNYLKNVVIHTHQNILWGLEQATVVVGKGQ